MTFVPGTRLLPKPLRRPAMVLFAIAQVLLALSPLAEIRAGSSEAHVEAAGISIHHSHDEASCVACAARVLLDGSSLPDGSHLAVGPASSEATVAVAGMPASRIAGARHSRAPPLNLA